MRITSSTLLETVAAMAIMGGVLACAGLVCSNVLAADASAQRTRARLAVDDAVAQVLIHGRVEAAVRPMGGIQVRVVAGPAGTDGQAVRFIATDAGGAVILEETRTLRMAWHE